MSAIPQHRGKIAQRDQGGRESLVIPRDDVDPVSFGVLANGPRMVEKRERLRV